MTSGGPGRSRRKRGSELLVPLGPKVPVRTREILNEVSDALGISASQYIEDLLERDYQARVAAASTAGDSTAAGDSIAAGDSTAAGGSTAA